MDIYLTLWRQGRGSFGCLGVALGSWVVPFGLGRPKNKFGQGPSMSFTGSRAERFYQVQGRSATRRMVRHQPQL